MLPIEHQDGGTEKSSVDEIRARFDRDVERFSDLNLGQKATIDSTLAMDLIAQAAAATSPSAKHVLDVGCGAGNYTLKLLEQLSGLDATLVDLSRPMLDRAQERIAGAGEGRVTAVQADIRGVDLGDESFDVILAASVLHHLRTDGEWIAVFRSFHRALRKGGSLWIFDLVSHDIAATRELMWQRYAAYLEELGGREYREHVFDYIDREDTPRSLTFQLDLLRSVGFRQIVVLHVHGPFATFGAVK